MSDHALNRCSGFWYSFDYRCSGPSDCIKTPTYAGAPRIPLAKPNVTLTWMGHIQNTAGGFNSVLSIKGDFVDLALIVYGVAEAPACQPSEAPAIAPLQGRLPPWNGPHCPYCDRQNRNYDPTRPAQRRHIRISYQVIEWETPDWAVLRLDSEDAPEFWLQFQVPAWMVRR